jgi:multiple sugar transport system ATP-binding protein
MGAEIYAYLDVDGVLMTARVNPRSHAKYGESLSLFVDLDTIHLFNKETEMAYI